MVPVLLSEEQSIPGRVSCENVKTRLHARKPDRVANPQLRAHTRYSNLNSISV